MYCCLPLGRGIILANVMHLAMRCLDNMLRSDSSGGMSASSKLLATAKVGRALSLRWLWQVWQIHSLLSSGISAVIITNMYILSCQACCNRIWIFLCNLTLWRVVLGLEMMSYDTQCTHKWDRPLFVIWTHIWPLWSKSCHPLCHSHEFAHLFLCISFLFSLHILSNAYS